MWAGWPGPYPRGLAPSVQQHIPGRRLRAVRAKGHVDGTASQRFRDTPHQIQIGGSGEPAWYPAIVDRPFDREKEIRLALYLVQGDARQSCQRTRM